MSGIETLWSYAEKLVSVVILYIVRIIMPYAVFCRKNIQGGNNISRIEGGIGYS